MEGALNLSLTGATRRPGSTTCNPTNLADQQVYHSGRQLLQTLVEGTVRLRPDGPGGGTPTSANAAGLCVSARWVHRLG